jgi:hypothetical protein
MPCLSIGILAFSLIKEFSIAPLIYLILAFWVVGIASKFATMIM